MAEDIEIINAESMYRLARKIADLDFQKELALILEDIKMAAESGMFITKIYQDVSNRVEAELKNRKFKVERTLRNPETETDISWINHG